MIRIVRISGRNDEVRHATCNDEAQRWGCGMQRATMRLWCAMMGSWYARGVKRWGRKSNNREVIANFTAKELSSGFVFSMP